MTDEERAKDVRFIHNVYHAVLKYGRKLFKKKPKTVECRCQYCNTMNTVIVKGTGRCECGNYYSWDGNVLWWNQQGTGIRFK